MRTLTILGTRPELIRICDWEKEILFTGQHFSYEMGQKFLTDASKDNRIFYYLPSNINHSDVDVLIKEIKKVIKFPFYENAGEIQKEIKPDYIIVHGDTRSALAGARVAKDFGIKLVHTESGVRCYQDTIEESIRKEIDILSDFNFCPIPDAIDNLKKEGITKGVYFSGDILYDRFLKHHIDNSWDFVFVTIHRFENIENKERLSYLIESLKKYKNVVFPVHPHTEECLDKFGITLPPNVLKLDPLDYDKTLRYIRDAKLVITDSGGLERESFWSGTPCEVLRNGSEWRKATSLFGNGNAGENIRKVLYEAL
jgi:UDP-GlcNAc3NAcA epimerase